MPQNATFLKKMPFEKSNMPLALKKCQKCQIGVKKCHLATVDAADAELRRRIGF